MENSEILLKRAIAAIHENAILDEEWAVGGGTVLAYYYRHRMSKDIDIFFENPQYLNGLSPRVNEVVESAVYYQEQSNSISLTFPEGKIDFIVAPNLTGYIQRKNNFFGHMVYLEDAVEIVIKKLFYRGEFLIGRDLFDLAVVGSSNRRKDLLRQLGKLGNKFVTFKEKFLQSKEELKDRAYSKLYKDAITDKIFSMNGKEIDICDKIIAEVNVIGTEVF